MNISSTPFIRNDYWPDYNDINQLNQRINEVENELSLTNIRLSTNIENVSNDLNSYANNQANTTIANNIIVNNINANYAVGKFVNFGNANFDNAYVENLTVNKPVFDITLNTPHIENVTSLGGNIYDVNMFNVSITGGNVAFNSVSIDDLTASNATISNVNILDGNVNLNKATISDINTSNATISNLFVNVSPEPIQSSAVLGYDSQGRVIPVEATYDVGFPENANYLYTDTHGTVFAGVAATEVSAVNNLITALAVQNGFNDVNNVFNDVNADVQNGFNDVNAIGNNRYNDILNVLNASIPGGIGLDLRLNYINSTVPVNYQAAENIIFTTGQLGNIWCNTAGKAGTQYYDWNSQTNTLTFSSLTGIIILNDNIYHIFSSCRNANFIGSFIIPNSVTSMAQTFSSCSNLNQNILIPNSVTSMVGTFSSCSNLNQNILIPNSVTYMERTFAYCNNLNQNILIPNSVTDMELTFSSCSNLNQNILIPNSVTSMVGTFSRCFNLNQNILIPNSVTDMELTFSNCSNLNQNILIPNSVTYMAQTFSNCSNLNQNIYIYSDTLSSIQNAFRRCNKLADKYIHIRSSIPMDTSNVIYNSLVNNYTDINWTGRVINDLEEPTQWPPV